VTPAIDSGASGFSARAELIGASRSSKANSCPVKTLVETFVYELNIIRISPNGGFVPCCH
jgi:hypothetical protein